MFLAGFTMACVWKLRSQCSCLDLSNRTSSGFSAFRAHGFCTVCVTYGRLIVSGSLDETIRIWNLTTGKHIDDPINAGLSVYTVVLSDDGHIIAGAGEEVCVSDLQTRDRISSMTGHTFNVRSVALSPDNSRIASGSVDSNIGLWDAQTYAQVGIFNGHTDTI